MKPGRMIFPAGKYNRPGFMELDEGDAFAPVDWDDAASDAGSDAESDAGSDVSEAASDVSDRPRRRAAPRARAPRRARRLPTVREQEQQQPDDEGEEEGDEEEEKRGPHKIRSDDRPLRGLAAKPPDDRLLVLPNPDKRGTGRRAGKAAWMPTAPCRILFVGPPGSGKTNNVLNIALRFEPKPTRIMVLHLDPDAREYKILEKVAPVSYYTPDQPPDFKDLQDPDEARAAAKDGEEPPRTLLIVDEVPTKALDKAGKSALERIANFGSTHKNTSILFSFQNLTSIEPTIRRAFNHFCLSPSADSGSTQLAAHRIGCSEEELKDLFGLCRAPTDSIWVDTTRNADQPLRFRLNILVPILRCAR